MELHHQAATPRPGTGSESVAVILRDVLISSNGGAITVTGSGSITGDRGGDGVDALIARSPRSPTSRAGRSAAETATPPPATAAQVARVCRTPTRSRR